MRQLQRDIVLLRPQVAGDVRAAAAEVDAMQAGVQLDAIAAALEAIAVYGLQGGVEDLDERNTHTHTRKTHTHAQREREREWNLFAYLFLTRILVDAGSEIRIDNTKGIVTVLLHVALIMPAARF